LSATKHTYPLRICDFFPCTGVRRLIWLAQLSHCTHTLAAAAPTWFHTHVRTIRTARPYQPQSEGPCTQRDSQTAPTPLGTVLAMWGRRVSRTPSGTLSSCMSVTLLNCLLKDLLLSSCSKHQHTASLRSMLPMSLVKCDCALSAVQSHAADDYTDVMSLQAPMVLCLEATAHSAAHITEGYRVVRFSCRWNLYCSQTACTTARSSCLFIQHRLAVCSLPTHKHLHAR
jgi:hypothetical protein